MALKAKLWVNTGSSSRQLQLSLFVWLLWLSAVLSESCRSTRAEFHPTDGLDCVSSSFTRTVSGLCSPQTCSIQCARVPNCQAFTVLTSGACQCKLFVFDACSHRVQSVPNCTNRVTVYVSSLPGVRPGRLCPPGYQHARYGTAYKLVTAETVKWDTANQSCSSDPGLSKFADAIDLNEVEHLRSLQQLQPFENMYLGGLLRSGRAANWLWTACDLPIYSGVWLGGEPNGFPNGAGCSNLYSGISTGGIDDNVCNNKQLFICECQSVF